MAQIWDGCELRLTFRRCVDAHTMCRWYELVCLVETTRLSIEADAPIWILTPSSVYFVRSLYKLVNFGGVSCDIKDCVWKINYP